MTRNQCTYQEHLWPTPAFAGFSDILIGTPYASESGLTLTTRLKRCVMLRRFHTSNTPSDDSTLASTLVTAALKPIGRVAWSPL